METSVELIEEELRAWHIGHDQGDRRLLPVVNDRLGRRLQDPHCDSSAQLLSRLATLLTEMKRGTHAGPTKGRVGSRRSGSAEGTGWLAVMLRRFGL